MAYFLDNYPVSEESANLVLTEEQEKNCRVVYKLSEDENDRGAYFAGLWEPDKTYSDEYVILPLKATGGDVVTLFPNSYFAPVKSFANVIGSSNDQIPPNTADSWIAWWKKLTKNNNPSCCTDGNFYYINNKGIECKFNKINVQNNEVNAKCSTEGYINGGHIIINAKSAATALPNSSVYIVPLCTNHNIGYAGDCSWGEGFYMKLKENTPAVKLKGYLVNIKDHIETLKKEDRHE
ncbi:MAG: hypothetical protein NC299_14440 [Lachnospiraceae bacterium]|nr:hypothetical protein [Ruminococcus sp.]MCM1276534.1 hypothetical protein [Lachnospiraceae bacterium]